jgi:isopentenyl-diphosphate delta-isomerase
LEDKDSKSYNIEADNTASSRKSDHIELAMKSAVKSDEADPRFNYESILAGHAQDSDDLSLSFLNKKMHYPLWISSMTGGTEKANTINKNLAKAAGQFGLGMGLGSCRQLLFDDSRLHEFDVRKYIGDQPLYANLGIAQVERLISENETNRIDNLINNLSADGLIVHVNPLQEWMQPEGDRYFTPPFETIKTLLERVECPIIVKEVGQGFGPESLKALLSLPLAAIDLAGFGGTNFSKLELLRSDDIRYSAFKDVFNLGHTCEEMLNHLNEFVSEGNLNNKCHQIIYSGGIKTFLDGFYFVKKSKLSSIYAQASGFLKHALDYSALEDHVNYQLEGLKMANKLLKVKY